MFSVKYYDKIKEVQKDFAGSFEEGFIVEDIKTARPTWVEVNLDHIEHNLQELGRHIGPETRIMAVVKANGYGHGAVLTARTALEAGASSLAVASPEEGVELRLAGVSDPILVFGYSPPEAVPVLQKYNLTPTILDFAAAQHLSESFAGSTNPMPVHLKVDTGMGRVGVAFSEAVEVITAISRLPGLYLEGLYTHLASAEEEDTASTEEQLSRFDEIIEACRLRELEIPVVHAANSAAAIAFPRARYDLVRPGISIYGSYPSPFIEKYGVSLIPALSFKSRIVFLKEVPAGLPIGYGATYRTKNKALIATVPVGYADGYMRSFSNAGLVLVGGREVPVVGRVCMDQIMINVSNVEEVSPGDEVVIYGVQEEARITVDKAAGITGTNSYELLCAISERVPRYYINKGNLFRGK